MPDKESTAARVFGRDPTDPRICVADGFGIRIFVRHRHLVVEDGIGRQRRERRYHPATSNLTRLVLIGNSGYLTIEAIRWLTENGVNLIHIDSSGEVLATAGTQGADKASLRRAQAWAAHNQTGIAITHEILRRKLGEQLKITAELGGDITPITNAIGALETADTLDHLMVLEASAAVAYWQAWAPVTIRFATNDRAKIPHHWVTFGQRSSTIGNGARLAISPINAVLNYLYALLEAETRLALLTVGLDPGIGILHADQRSRDNLALDLMETTRPTIDRYVLQLLDGHVFRGGDFIDTRRGICRINPPLSHHLAATIPRWASAIAPHAEWLTQTLTNTPGIRLDRTATPLTQTNRRRGRDTTRRRQPTQQPPSPPLPEANCLECGTPIEKGRKRCNPCNGRYQQGHLTNIHQQSLNVLEALRNQGRDPAHGGDTATKRATTVTQQNAQSAAWDQTNKRPNPETWTTKVLPGLANVTLTDMMQATGLSSGYCSMIRRGDKTPHPRHWKPLHDLINNTGGG